VLFLFCQCIQLLSLFHAQNFAPFSSQLLFCLGTVQSMLAGVSSTVVAGTSAVVVGSTAFGIFTKCIFRVAKPSQYLVQTGLGIKDPVVIFLILFH
jgi:hypothetical protein